MSYADGTCTNEVAMLLGRCRTRILTQEDPKEREKYLMKFIKIMRVSPSSMLDTQPVRTPASVPHPQCMYCVCAVSYTHLTLPTKLSV